MLMGDFNAHSKILCTKCVRLNFTGATLKNLIMHEDICLINPVNFYTYVNSQNGKRSCLDLCLTSSNIASEA